MKVIMTVQIPFFVIGHTFFWAKIVEFSHYFCHCFEFRDVFLPDWLPPIDVPAV